MASFSEQLMVEYAASRVHDVTNASSNWLERALGDTTIDSVIGAEIIAEGLASLLKRMEIETAGMMDVCRQQTERLLSLVVALERDELHMALVHLLALLADVGTYLRVVRANRNPNAVLAFGGYRCVLVVLQELLQRALKRLRTTLDAVSLAKNDAYLAKAAAASSSSSGASGASGISGSSSLYSGISASMSNSSLSSLIGSGASDEQLYSSDPMSYAATASSASASSSWPAAASASDTASSAATDTPSSAIAATSPRSLELGSAVGAGPSLRSSLDSVPSASKPRTNAIVIPEERITSVSSPASNRRRMRKQASDERYTVGAIPLPLSPPAAATTLGEAANARVRGLVVGVSGAIKKAFEPGLEKEELTGTSRMGKAFLRKIASCMGLLELFASKLKVCQGLEPSSFFQPLDYGARRCLSSVHRAPIRRL